MACTYIISDTHFNHEAIIEYCDRPFKSVYLMNQYMINRWNETVKKHDTVIHLGDFAFGNAEYVKELLSQLNGRKVLIMGNHDRRISKSVKKWYDMGWDEVSRHPILYKKFYWLSHEPIKHLTEDIPYYNLHGHIHNNEPQSSHHINLSVEQIGYTPVNLDLIINKLRKDFK